MVKVSNEDPPQVERASVVLHLKDGSMKHLIFTSISNATLARATVNKIGVGQKVSELTNKFYLELEGIATIVKG